VFLNFGFFSDLGLFALYVMTYIGDGIHPSPNFVYVSCTPDIHSLKIISHKIFSASAF
jgi:hypothetical protein